MGYFTLPLFYEGAFGGGEMDSVCEDCTRGEESMGIVDGSVGGVGGEEGVYK